MDFGCVILMDQDFKIRSGTTGTGHKKGLIVSNSCRQLFLKNWTRREAEEWVACIQQAIDTTGIHANCINLPSRTPTSGIIRLKRKGLYSIQWSKSIWEFCSNPRK